ncbi:MAG: sodium/solute symporter [Planctomycetes bacterium]|nr:sodium/solute symporter [Planctomycetota bacterium]
MGSLSPLDGLVIGAYFAAVLGVAGYATWVERRGKETSSDYFLAGRNAGWLMIGASLFASNIGAEHLVGLAGTGAASGVAVGHFEVEATLMLLILCWVFVPFYLRSGVFTMPEFLERRYASAARWYLAVVSIIGYVLTKISVNIAAGGIVLQSLGIDFWTGALVIVTVTGIYTILGGLRAVLYTDFLQMIVFVVGSASLIVLGLRETGGWNGMVELAGSDHLSMWKPWTDATFPWTGILFGGPILGIWYWCTDQYIVQRVLSARNIDQAQRGSIFAAFLKLLPLFLFVIPGVIAYCLAKTGRFALEAPDDALPTLIRELLPAGLRGLVVAGLLAAIMSSLSSVFNSCSTLVTFDVYRKLHPSATDRQLVVAGQFFTVVMVVAGLAWIPFMKDVSRELYQYLQSVQAYIAPPISAVFVLGITWKRANAHGAMAALVGGFLLGAARLVMELNKDHLPDGLAMRYVEINFLHFACLLFLVCVAVQAAVSLATRPPSDKTLSGLTFATAPNATAPNATAPNAKAAERTERTVNIGLSWLAAAGVVACWLYFRG